MCYGAGSASSERQSDVYENVAHGRDALKIGFMPTRGTKRVVYCIDVRIVESVEDMETAGVLHKGVTSSVAMISLQSTTAVVHQHVSPIGY
jgi:hypothetical protein